MDTAELEYELPPELIAQAPAERRDASRLLVFRRESGAIEHRVFSELPELLAGELVVVNDTRVVPARLSLRRESGGAVEILLLEQLEDALWEALARPARRLRAGERLGPVQLVEPLGDGRWKVRLDGEPDGETPLPPYIHRPLGDPARYQTVYAREAGSAAAPTAGLHLTPELVSRLDPVAVTLHVGLDTFRPVATETLEEHVLHGERYSVAADAWTRIECAQRVLAVGTTTVRVAGDGRARRAARGTDVTVRHARVRVPAGGRAAHELPPSALEPARARDGVRGCRGDARALPRRGRRALPLLLVRRRDARA